VPRPSPVSAAGAPEHSPARASLATRLGRYQQERFQLAGFVPLIVVFTFSSAAYSRVARGASGFVPWGRFAIGAATALTFFFLLRVLDEHKDREVDRRFRPELPVPRGLVTLGELRSVGAAALIVVVALNALVVPVLLVPIALVAVWAALMTREFFAPVWLRAHPTAYLVTHMAIMPLIDGYTTGLDWLAEGRPAPHGLVAFLAVTFLNGMVIEVGRKVRAPADEREGVDTYTRAWGVRTAPALWIALLAASAGTAWIALRAVGGNVFAVPLVLLGAACAAPSVVFISNPGRRAAHALENASRVWPLATYLMVGALPLLRRGSG
jgi:4-hydroxybenzoate polyprenyltransferase